MLKGNIIVVDLCFNSKSYIPLSGYLGTAGAGSESGQHTPTHSYFLTGLLPIFWKDMLRVLLMRRLDDE